MTMYISPYRRIAGLREAMNRMFEDTISESSNMEREMLLAVDVRAEDEAYQITALVPGLEADDLSIEIINNTVSCAGDLNRWWKTASTWYAAA
jgi:HSP20 family protein